MIMEYEMKLNILARFFTILSRIKTHLLITLAMTNNVYVILSLIDILMKIKLMILYRH